MKKLFSITMLLLVATMCFSQAKNVSKANRLSNAEENPDFDTAIDLIEQALKDETTKNLANTWYVAANVYSRIINYEYEKPSMGAGSTDRERQQESAYKAYDYYLKAVELEAIPDAKGKVSNKLTKKAAQDLAWYFNNGWLVNYGAAEGQIGNYATALKAFEKHLSIPDLPFVIAFVKEKKEKDDNKNPRPKKENNDSLYWNVKFFDAIYTQLYADDVKDEAKKEELTNATIQKYEAIKDKGYEEGKIYHYLYNLYNIRNDSVNMIRIVDEGIVRLPNEIFFIGMKINFLLEKGQGEEAIEYLQTAIERDPSNGKYYNILGNIHNILGKNVEAMKNYDKAIELEPENANFQISKGAAIYSEAQAIETASLTTRDPKTAEMLKATATAKFKEAEGYFLNALEFDEYNCEAYKKLVSYYYKFITTEKKKYDDINRKAERNNCN